MKDYLILPDGTAIELEAFSSLENLLVLSADKQTMLETWDRFASSNLENIKIVSPEGTIIGKYENAALVSETSYVQTDGSILTSFKLTGEQSKNETNDTEE